MTDRVPTWTIGLHALDRTGPPMLALAFARWLRTVHPDHRLQVASFRGGPLLEDFARLGLVAVLLDPSEPWCHEGTDDARIEQIRQRASALGESDALLLVSIAAGQLLPHLSLGEPPVLTWVVERGEDLHWLRSSPELERRTTRWLAGSRGGAAEVVSLLGPTTEVAIVPEFIEPPRPLNPTERVLRRRSLGATDDQLLVAGAGICTWRKAPDLFLAAAVQANRRFQGEVRWVWFGGEQDPLFRPLLDEVRRLDAGRWIRFIGNVTDVDPWLAAADVLVHPARLDAFPLVCLHAASQGTPVLAFEESGGVAEMFGDRFVGATFPDVDGLVQQVARLRDPQLRQSIGSAQRDIVRDHHLSSTAADTVLSELVMASGGCEP